MTLLTFFAIVVGVILAVFAVAVLALRRRDVNYEKLVNTTAFHCLRCDSVYTSREGGDIANCPNCGYKNPKLKF